MKKVFSIFLLALILVTVTIVPVSAAEVENTPAVVDSSDVEFVWNYTFKCNVLSDDTFKYIIVVRGLYDNVFVLYSDTPWVLERRVNEGNQNAWYLKHSGKKGYYGVVFNNADIAVDFLFDNVIPQNLNTFYYDSTDVNITYISGRPLEILYSIQDYNVYDRVVESSHTENAFWPSKVPTLAFHAHKSLLLRVLKELMGLLPIVVPPLLAFIALRKGIAYIMDVLHSG